MLSVYKIFINASLFTTRVHYSERKTSPKLRLVTDTWQQSKERKSWPRVLHLQFLGNSMRRAWWFVSKQTKCCEIATHVLESFPKHAPPQSLLPASHNPCFNGISVDGTNYPRVLWCIFPFSNGETAEKRARATSSKRAWPFNNCRPTRASLALGLVLR